MRRWALLPPMRCSEGAESVEGVGSVAQCGDEGLGHRLEDIVDLSPSVRARAAENQTSISARMVRAPDGRERRMEIQKAARVTLSDTSPPVGEHVPPVAGVMPQQVETP